MNLTQLSGGMARNVVPAELSVTFDIRVAPPTDLKEFEQQIMTWIAEAEGDDADSGRITYRFESVTFKLFLILLVNFCFSN